MRSKVVRFLAVVLLVGPIAASAAVLIQIERGSDTQGTVTAWGHLGEVAPLENRHVLVLDNPFGIGPDAASNANVLASSAMYVGGVKVDFADDAGTNYSSGFIGTAYPLVYFGTFADGGFATNSGFVGSLTLRLVGGSTLGTIGSRGDVYWGGYRGTQILIGSWAIVEQGGPGPFPAPEPGTLALLGLGLLGLGVTRRKAA